MVYAAVYDSQPGSSNHFAQTEQDRDELRFEQFEREKVCDDLGIHPLPPSTRYHPHTLSTRVDMENAHFAVLPTHLRLKLPEKEPVLRQKVPKSVKK